MMMVTIMIIFILLIFMLSMYVYLFPFQPTFPYMTDFLQLLIKYSLAIFLSFTTKQPKHKVLFFT